MLTTLTLTFRLCWCDICGFRSVAVDSEYKLQFITFIFAVSLPVLSSVCINCVYKQHFLTFILLSVPCYHRLRGSASPVLTATGFVNGKWQFSTRTESTPFNLSPNNLSQVITLATPMAVPN